MEFRMAVQPTLVSAVGDGSTTLYTFQFDYLDPAYVKVRVDGSDVPFTFTNTKTVTLATAPANGSTIIISRETSRERLVDFTDGSVLIEDDLDLADTQLLHIVQEAFDLSATTLTPAEDGALSTGGRRITDLGEPISSSDAVTVSWAEGELTAQIVTATNAAANAARVGAETARDEAETARDQAVAIAGFNPAEYLKVNGTKWVQDLTAHDGKFRLSSDSYSDHLEFVRSGTPTWQITPSGDGLRVIYGTSVAAIFGPVGATGWDSGSPQLTVMTREKGDARYARADQAFEFTNGVTFNPDQFTIMNLERGAFRHTFNIQLDGTPGFRHNDDLSVGDSIQIHPRGTDAPALATVMTREKGDHRYQQNDQPGGFIASGRVNAAGTWAKRTNLSATITKVATGHYRYTFENGPGSVDYHVSLTAILDPVLFIDKEVTGVLGNRTASGFDVKWHSTASTALIDVEHTIMVTRV